MTQSYQSQEGLLCHKRVIISSQLYIMSLLLLFAGCSQRQARGYRVIRSVKSRILCITSDLKQTCALIKHTSQDKVLPSVVHHSCNPLTSINNWTGLLTPVSFLVTELLYRAGYNLFFMQKHVHNSAIKASSYSICYVKIFY